MNWFKAKENYKSTIDQDEIFQKAILSNKTTWAVYSNVEKIYERFIKNHSVRTYRCPIECHVKAQNWNKQVIFDNAFI
jgi:hypothetical protein